MLCIIISVISLLCLHSVAGHGMMLEPPNRSSLWRTNERALINYNDNENFCGGFYKQYFHNKGRCGLCGDNFDDPHPQNNENTGKFGQGIIAATYKSGSVIDVHILLTANHKGSFNYSLCQLEDPNQPESGEECFMDLTLENGKYHSIVDPHVNEYVDRVKLPEGVTCERCVLRWTYRAGNNWGVCKNGYQGPGCGNQEHFRNCADISII